MIRRTFRVAILLFVSSLVGVYAAWAADPYGSIGGGLEQTQSPYQGMMGTQGTMGSSPMVPGLQSPYPQPSSMSPFPQGVGSIGESSIPSMETGAAPRLEPLPPERQSAFEQLVSGKVEITKVQFDIIQKDPNIKFSNTLAVPPPGSVVVAVKIVPLPEKKDPRFQPTVQPTIQPPEVDAGYLTGTPDRIGEMFPSSGSAAPIRSRWISSTSGPIFSSRGVPASSRPTGYR